MERPELKRPELEDREVVDGWFRNYPGQSCDRTFANVYLWSRFYKVKYAVYRNVLIFEDTTEGCSYAWPAGELEDVRAVFPILEEWAREAGEAFHMYGVTKDQFASLDSWYPGRYQYTETRDYADYVYEAEKLATLSGKKLHSKRNHINRFKILYEDRWDYERLTEDNVEECFQMALEWRNLNEVDEDEEKNAEMSVTLNSLRLFRELQLTGGILRVDGKIVAFTLGEPLNEDTFVVHIEKALADVEGAYTVINQQFVEHEILGKYKYVNREDDVGQEGLRKAKLSYKPAFLVEKGTVTLASR